MKKIFLFFVLLSVLPTILSAQWTTLDLSELKFYTQAAYAEGKALFIGGAKPGFIPSKKIEIYDFENDTLIIRNMTFGRILSGVVVADSLVFIAGGVNPQTGAIFSQVEIYDVKNDQWKTPLALNIARAGIAAVRVGNELWFAGGDIQTSATDFNYYDIINVYNLTTEQWSEQHLSIPRFCYAGVLNGKVVFAGGASDSGPVSVVDIYDIPSGTWSTAELSIPRMNIAVATAGPYMLFAGGSTYTEDALDVVDMYNTVDSTWSIASLSAPRAFIGAGGICDSLAIFAGGGDADWTTKALTTSSNVVDIFNANTGYWSQDTLTQARSGTFAASGDTHFFVGGGWNPEGIGLLKSIEIYSCSQTSRIRDVREHAILKVSPNPGQEMVRIELETEKSGQMELMDITGRLLISQSFSGNEVQLNTTKLPAGTYMISLRTEKSIMSPQLWIKAN